MRKLIFSFILSAVTLSSLAAVPGNLYTVTAQPLTQTLYFSGTVSPIRIVPVVSPTAGVIDQKFFIYGQVVKQGQPLLHVQTDKLLNDLWAARIDDLNAAADYEKLKNWQSSSDMMNAQTSYERALRSFSQDKSTYLQNQELYKLGIIAEQDLLNSKNTYQDSEASVNQAKLSLDQTITQGKGNALLIGELKLKSAEQKFKSLENQYHTTTITAPASGIILQTDSNTTDTENSSGQKANGKIQVSTVITYQQVLFNIGNLSGVKVNFSVPETNINQVQKGQTAVITGAGFPNISLMGVVTEVAAQAANDSGSVPSFPVTVEVASISAQDRQVIRSGMDAQVALNVYSAQHAIAVPVAAVSQNSQGQSVVQVYDPKNKTSYPTVVTTGAVTTDQVEIKSGLSAGQQITVPGDV